MGNSAMRLSNRLWCPLGQRGQQLLDQFTGSGCCGVQMAPAFFHLGKRNGRHAKQIPFHRRTDSA